MMTLLNEPANAFAIHLETEHYVLRSLDSADATASWGDWLAEPTTARALNAAPVKLDIAMIHSYVATFDRKKSHLLGIFDKASGTLVGIRAIYIDWPHREFMVNVLVGEVDARGKGARTETRNVIYHYMFEDLGLEIARVSVLSTNAPVLRLMNENGWTLIHSTQKPSASGGPMVQAHEFQLTRDQNRRLERRRGLFQQAKAS